MLEIDFLCDMKDLMESSTQEELNSSALFFPCQTQGKVKCCRQGSVNGAFVAVTCELVSCVTCAQIFIEWC